MTGAALAAGHGIDGERIDYLRIRHISRQGRDQRFTGIQVRRATVENKRDNSIKLTLLICKPMLVNKLIDRILEGDQSVTQGRVSFFLGHRSLHVLLNLIIRATGAIANGVFSVCIQIGCTPESFKMFNEGNAILTGLHIRRRTGCGSQQENPQQHGCSQAYTQQLLHHGSCSFFCRISHE